MPYFGSLILMLAMVVGALGLSFSFLGHFKQNRRLAVASEYSVYASLGLYSVASAIMVWLFVTGDYAVKYVVAYSDRSMPLFYKITSFWGGLDGSMLFWLWVMSIWAALAVWQNREQNRRIMPFTIATLLVIMIFLNGILLYESNPFTTELGLAPTDGRGLNPMLQNAYMVTHPPALYLGYIGWSIPFAFAVGALGHGVLDYSWISAMRRYCLMAWMFLTVGLVLGGLWAYEELGWGGYWAWDPVENAALIPWLTGTAYIHSIQVQERRQMYKLWNFLLIIITFLLTMLGTMMTRSGVVESVHAFARSDIGEVFLAFIVFAAVVSFGLLIWRMPQLKPQYALESILSREFAFLLNNWVLLGAAFFVTFATLFPALYKALFAREVNVGPSFYNLWMIPIGLILLFLTGVGPLLSWRKSSQKTLWEQFLVPAIVGLLAFVLSFWAFGQAHWVAELTLGLSAFVFWTLVQEFWRGTRQRMKKAKVSAFDALLTLITRQKRRYGGYVVHFGVVLMFVGFAGESFKIQKDQTLKVGDITEIGRYQVRLDGLNFADDGQKSMITAKVSAFLKGGEAAIGSLEPARWAYRKPEEQVTTEVSKLMSLRDDLYIVLGGFDGQSQTATLQMKVNPLVNWVWMGSAFMLLGFVIAIAKSPAEQKQRRRVGRLIPPLAAVSGTACALLAVWAAFQSPW